MAVLSRNYCQGCDQVLNEDNWCHPCERAQFIENFDNWTSGHKDIDDFIRETQLNAKNCCDYLEWIPFDSFIGVNKYDSAEVGVVYTANWKQGPRDAWDENESKFEIKRELIKVALISINKSAELFLKEVKTHYYARNRNGLIIRLLGITRETVTGVLMMVAETVEWDLRHYVSHHFARITWQKKITILHSIAYALERAQNGEQVHRDTVSDGKIYKSHIEIPVNELGLGDDKDPIPIIGYYKYDLLSYIAPEFLRGRTSDQKFITDNRQSDIYTFGILMWELATNKPPYYDKTHDSNLIKLITEGNLRPTLNRQNTISIPKCYIELMMRCWQMDPGERPTIKEVIKHLSDWDLRKVNREDFEKCEAIRLQIERLKGRDTTPDKLTTPPKIHPQAIYSSRKLNFPLLNLSDAAIANANTGSNRYNSKQRISKSNDVNSPSLFARDQSYFTKDRLLQKRIFEVDVK